jgi:hypothetical protein
MVIYDIYHHHRPLIPPCGVGTTYFLLPFSSITRHLHVHSFYFHVIFHTIHPSFPRSTSTRVPIYIIILRVIYDIYMIILCHTYTHKNLSYKHLRHTYKGLCQKTNALDCKTQCYKL